MQSFSNFTQQQQRLDEKALVINNNAKYGQIVFMAGGAGSGKGFAQEKFMNNTLFKIRDVDAWKLAFIELDKIFAKYKEVRGLNLKKSEDVAKLHMFVNGLGIKNRTLDKLLLNMTKGRLPNLLFDITAKDTGDITKPLKKLIEVGYDPKDVHIVWVLTAYDGAVLNNKGRDRVVPADILLGTHSGAAATMNKVIFKGGLPKDVDGSISIILNNREETEFYDKKTEIKRDGKILKYDPSKQSKKFITPKEVKAGDGKGKKVVIKGLYKMPEKHKTVKNFTYILVKKSGKSGLTTHEDFGKHKDVQTWMDNNIPLTDQTFDAHTLGSTLTKPDLTPQPKPTAMADLTKKLAQWDDDVLKASKKTQSRRK